MARVLFRIGSPPRWRGRRLTSTACPMLRFSTCCASGPRGWWRQRSRPNCFGATRGDL